ncbi:MAG: type II toxin-antitoxin system RelE/ParE family toxin [Patescibacteria group bacterium]
MGIRCVVKYHPLVVRDDIPKIDVNNRLRIKTAIEQKLATRPDLFGIPLRRSLKGHRKIRVGDYRIVYRIESNVVFVFAIMHRSVVYERIRRRI